MEKDASVYAGLIACSRGNVSQAKAHLKQMEEEGHGYPARAGKEAGSYVTLGIMLTIEAETLLTMKTLYEAEYLALCALSLTGGGGEQEVRPLDA